MRRYDRRGAAVVEFAVVAPLLILLIFGLVEYGRMVMVQQMLTNASREGARVGILDYETATDRDTAVKQAVKDRAGNVDLDDSDIVIEPATITGETVTVTVSIPFSEVSWLPTHLTKYVGVKDNLTLSASSIMRRESVQ